MFRTVGTKKVNYRGIFDTLTGKTATLTSKSALVLSAITVIAADGVTDDAELNDLARIVCRDRKSIDAAMDVPCGQTRSRLSLTWCQKSWMRITCSLHS